MWLFDHLKDTGWKIGFRWRFVQTGYREPMNYFKPLEVDGLTPELIDKLKTARHVAGVPFIITSGKRTANQNSVLKGAVSDSSHLTGKAVDLAVGGSREYFLMMKGLYAAGFRRIGQYLNAAGDDVIHLHVDVDDTKDQDVIFTKREQN